MWIMDQILSIRNVFDSFNELTVGEVVDTNDPQQMGRIKAICPYLGDDADSQIENLPWVTYVTSYGGSSDVIARGRNNEQSGGSVSYGTFNIPKVGSYVLVGCIEGDPKWRIWLGCLHDQYLPHTAPHGRYSYKLNNEPSGPLTSEETPIQPLYDNQTKAFSKSQDTTNVGLPSDARKNFEYRTRGVDGGNAGISSLYIDTSVKDATRAADDYNEQFREPDGNLINHTQGYKPSQIEPGLESNITGLSLDPQVSSWTTPGFHAISMDDSADNCRLRLRTTGGNQIILDDTNERIYVSTSEGKSWIELDEKGNVDIYAFGNISTHAERDINFTAGGTFRVKAKKGIHLISEDEVRIHSKGTLHLKSDETIEIHSTGTMDISVSDIFLTAEIDIHIKAANGVLNLDSGSDINILAAGNIMNTASQIHFNGPPAEPAFSSTPSNTFEAWWTNRIPEHEPWARMMTSTSKTDQDSGNTHSNAGEFSYNSVNVGKVEREIILDRNDKWHR